MEIGNNNGGKRGMMEEGDEGEGEEEEEEGLEGLEDLKINTNEL